MQLTPEELDRQVRGYVYETATRRGYPPTVAEAAAHLSAPAEQVRSAFERLAAGRVLVLQRDTGEILMANPFSAVLTPFLVELASFSCFGNCIWDALGIAAMLKQDARIRTACGDCGTAMAISVVNDTAHADQGVIHFALPALRWWEDIVFN